MLYVAYGSNISTKQMEFRCPTAKLIDTGVIEDYKLVFKGCADIIYSKGDKVDVAVYDIKQSDEDILDIYEGFPDYYTKKYVDVKTVHSGICECMVYVMNNNDCLSCPTRYYFDIVEDGYKECGFNIDVLYNALRDVFSNE